MTDVIYHLVPIDYWEAQPADRPYVPADYAREGFIHCTKDVNLVAIVANRYYRNDQREWLVLVLDEQAITAEIKYEPGQDGLLFPHIYGALNREAIREVRTISRDPEGAFSALTHS
jgi:uncharacterized protein (DUF952 family)